MLNFNVCFRVGVCCIFGEKKVGMPKGAFNIFPFPSCWLPSGHAKLRRLAKRGVALSPPNAEESLLRDKFPFFIVEVQVQVQVQVSHSYFGRTAEPIWLILGSFGPLRRKNSNGTIFVAIRPTDVEQHCGMYRFTIIATQ